MSSENGVNLLAPNPSHNSSFSLLSVLRRKRLTGPNYMDWMRNLMFTLRYENKEYVLDEQIPTINDDSTQKKIEAHKKHYDDANKVSCIMASSMSPELQKTFENTWAYEMNQQLKEIASICAFVLEMKGYFDMMESLNMVFDAELSINMILSSLPADYNQFVLSYKKNRKETLIMELHSLLQTVEQGIKKIYVPSTSAAFVLTVGHNAKKRKYSHSNWKGKAAQGKSDRGSKRKVKSEIAPTITPRIFQVNKVQVTGTFDGRLLKSYHYKDLHALHFGILLCNTPGKHFDATLFGGVTPTSNPKEAVCFYCNTKGHWKQSCPKYMKDLKDGKVKKGGHSGMFMIELYNTTTSDSWVPDTGYGYVYLIKDKSDTFEVFKRYQNKVKNQLIRKIKLTSLRTPQLNGVAGRRNITLLDMGCEVFIRREAHDKLETRSKKCLFVGYPEESFGYLFYKPKDNVVFVARRGVFLKTKMISKEDSRSKIDFEEIQESADEEPIVNTNTQQEVVTPVEPDDISLPIHITISRVSKPPQFYYDFHIKEDKISDSTLSELDESANYKEAMASPEAAKRKEAIKSKIRSMVIEGVVQPVAPTTAEQKLARKNELKARGTLLMALPDKHQLKFNIHKDAKTIF
nr:hypothetical protein [Tanacetum cinerariifolium]